MSNLNASDVEFLTKNLDIRHDLTRKLLEIKSGAETMISSDECDYLRDLCTDKLDQSGFDDNYRPNHLGERLETLIDKLYCG